MIITYKVQYKMIAVLCCCFLKPHEFSMAVGLIENPVEVYGKYV